MKKFFVSRREFLRFSALGALGAALAACAPAAPATQPAEPAGDTGETAPTTPPSSGGTQMVFWPEWGGKDSDALQVQCNKFAEESGIAVDFLPIRDHARMVASISAGDPPDLLMTWDSNAVGTWGFQKALLDLTPLIQGAGLDLNNFYQIGLDSGNLMGIKQIGLPLTNYLTSILWYNTQAFEEAGLDPKKPPETWEETWAASEKLTKVEDGQIRKLGYMVGLGQDGTNLMAYAFGGSIWSDDYRKVTPDSEANIAELTWKQQFYKTYTTDEIIRWSGSIEQNASLPSFVLFTGDAAMQVSGEWMPSMYEILDPIPPISFGYLPYPEAKPEVKGTMTANTNPMVIPTAAKNPDGAFKFIEFISKADNSSEMCAIVGNASPTKDGLAKQIAATNSPTYKQILEEVWTKANVKPMTINSPVGSEYMDAVTRATDSVLQDGADPKEEMAKVREEFQPKLDQALADLGI